MGQFRCGKCDKLYDYSDIDFEDPWFKLLLEKGWGTMDDPDTSADGGVMICPKCKNSVKENFSEEKDIRR